MIQEILKECEAMLEGHFLLSSGKHSNRYIQCAKLLQYPDKSEIVLREVANKLKDLDIDVIVGPAMGGVVVAYELARQMGKKGIFTERENGEMTLRRGFTINKGDKVIISEDVITTGKSTKEVIKVIEELGGEVLGVACIVDRTSESIGYPVYSAIKLEVESFNADECPLCRENIPYTKPGSRAIK